MASILLSRTHYIPCSKHSLCVRHYSEDLSTFLVYYVSVCCILMILAATFTFRQTHTHTHTNTILYINTPSGQKKKKTKIKDEYNACVRISTFCI